MPMVYPPTELGRQVISYELGGPGIIPGGMPSGVPPSVYLTPVDAQNQQYMSRGMTMIPEGMPTGVPASVYRTPMDALNHQQVNRDIMSSVNGNAMQYSTFQCSPELFPPVGSVYYTAPNTAAPVNTHMFREPATSEQTVSEQVSEADSGIERSECGRSLSNSRSQREELRDGQSTMSRSALRSAETGNRKSVRCASISNDGQVFLFVSSDSDVPDGSENRPVSTEKQSELSKRKDEPSAKRKIAEQTAQTARTRKSNSKHVARSEKVSKGRRDRSASKERHRSRSVSKERRVSDRQKSGKQVHRGDKVVLVGSTDDSSSESDEDELSSPSTVLKSRHVMKPPRFDGKTSFETFWAQFQNCVNYSEWAQAQQLAFLKNALEKDAANVLWDYGKEVTESLTSLTKTLKMRFGGENFAEKNRIELRNRRRSPGETLTDLHIDIRRLSALAYPDTDYKTRELISCDYFIDALLDPELGFKIREKQPKDLDSAFHTALQLEVWAQDSERAAQSLVTEQTNCKKVRELTQQGDDAVAVVNTEIAEQRKIIACLLYTSPSPRD